MADLIRSPDSLGSPRSADRTGSIEAEHGQERFVDCVITSLGFNRRELESELDPQAGEPLLGQLVGWRKLTVGDRDWRVVWRVSSDEAGTVTITVSEVWAIGARTDADVYAEMTERVAALGPSPATQALSSVIEMLGRHAQRPDIQAATEPTHDPVPEWLQERLVRTAGITADDVQGMTGAEAMSRWEQFMQTGR